MAAVKLLHLFTNRGKKRPIKILKGRFLRLGAQASVTGAGAARHDLALDSLGVG